MWYGLRLRFSAAAKVLTEGAGFGVTEKPKSTGRLSATVRNKRSGTPPEPVHVEERLSGWLRGDRRDGNDRAGVSFRSSPFDKR